LNIGDSPFGIIPKEIFDESLKMRKVDESQDFIDSEKTEKPE
jgi:hypothetical protein